MEKKKYDIVKRRIDQYDYMALLASGCPTDEFDMESRSISAQITSESSIDEIAPMIAQVFEKTI